MNRKYAPWIIATLIAAFVLAIGVANSLVITHHEDCLVYNKYPIYKADPETKRIVTSCGGFLLKDDAEVTLKYPDIEVGLKYDIESRGWRIPTFRTYPVIASIEEG